MAESSQDDKLDLKVRDGNGAVTHFKVKKSTKFRKILTAYAGKAGINPDTIRMMVDGQRVHLEQCPGDYDMESGDQIDAMAEQQGGKRDPGNTPLLTACFDGDVDAARLALDGGADVNRADEDGVTPLFVACQQGHVDVARLLLDNGAEVDRTNRNGPTPLFVACQNGHVDAARLLLDESADVNATAPPQHHYVPASSASRATAGFEHAARWAR